MSKFDNHFVAMQDLMRRYVEPGNYISRDGETAVNQADADRLFANDMIYMLDGPEQREAQAEATFECPALIPGAITSMVNHIYGLNVKAGWWSDLVTGQPKERNVGELLCLVHSEISEGLEGHRKSLMDDHLPHRPMLEVEMADAVIRIFDLCGGLKLDLGGAMVEKLEYNQQRADHKIEARQAPGGKSI